MSLKSGQTQKEIFSVCADTKMTHTTQAANTDNFFLFFSSSFTRFHASLIRWTHRVCCGCYLFGSRHTFRIWESVRCGVRLSRPRYKLNRLKDVVKTFYDIYAFDLHPIRSQSCVSTRNCIKCYRSVVSLKLYFFAGCTVWTSTLKASKKKKRKSRKQPVRCQNIFHPALSENKSSGFQFRFR